MPLTPAQRARFQAIRSGATVSEAASMSTRPGLTGQFLRAAGHRGQELINLLPGEQFDSNMLELPEAQTFGEKAAQFVGGLAPDLALGVATAPIALGVRGALLAKGAGKLASLAAGELAQSAALSPIEFATRKPGEALGVTALSALAGTGIGALGLKLAGRRAASLVGEAVEKTAKATPAELEAFRREAEGRILERARIKSQMGQPPGAREIDNIRLEAGDEVADKVIDAEKQAWKSALRESVAKLGKPGCQ